MSAWFVLKNGTNVLRCFPVPGKCFLGRDPSSPVPIEDDRIARLHCLLYQDENAWKIRDLCSPQGTLVNYKYVKEATLLSGDQVILGDTVVGFYQTRPGARRGPERRCELVDLADYLPDTRRLNRKLND